MTDPSTPSGPPTAPAPDQALMEDLAALGDNRPQRSRTTRALIAVLLISFGCLLGSCMTRTFNPTPPPGAPTGAPATSAPAR